MSLDWDKIDDEIDTAIEECEDTTDEKLASKISSITRLTDEEIVEMFPNPVDVKRVKELMKIVKSADDHNTKVRNLIEKSEALGGVILTLLEKLA